MAAKLAQVAPRTVQTVNFPSYAATSNDLEVRMIHGVLVVVVHGLEGLGWV